MYGGSDRRGMRKPLVIFTPKSLLRHQKCVSTLKDFTTGHFQPVIGDAAGVGPDRISKVLLCTGKIYYELLAAREARESHNVAILRLEQMYPWPAEEIDQMLWRHPSTADIVWVQEEPRNMGAWAFVRGKLQPMLDKSRRTLQYAGRPEAASPAAGSAKRHAQEQAAVIEDAFSAATWRPRRYKVVARKKRDAPAS
jgi:2-oxoglutarate dehydrogenase E1 component